MESKLFILFVITMCVILLIYGITMLQQGNIFEGSFHLILNTFSIIVLTKCLINNNQLNK
jgi:hypothetical protein